MFLHLDQEVFNIFLHGENIHLNSNMCHIWMTSLVTQMVGFCSSGL